MIQTASAGGGGGGGGGEGGWVGEWRHMVREV